MARPSSSLAKWQHPLSFNSSRHWRRLLRMNGGVDPGFRLRAALVSALSRLTAPTRALERLVYGSRVNAVAVQEPPVLILGYWRSGTTHLHNLMSQDPRLGFVSTLQAMIPNGALVGRRVFRQMMLWTIPPTRPMDNMAFSPDLPQEDEFALCHQVPYSIYTGLFFPRNRHALYEKYATFDGLTPEELAEWQEAYLAVIKKATLLFGGRRLVLKNPANTGRIPHLLRLFPDAKFIHIHRNPYTVFRSAMKLMLSLREIMPFQHVGEQEIEDDVFYLYRAMLQRYLAEKDEIPAGNLVEVRYDDLDQHPIEELARVYSALSLPGWREAEAPIARYLAGQAGYVKNRFTLSPEDCAKIEEHWGFAIDAWGYSRP